MSDSQIVQKTCGALNRPQKLRSLIVAYGKKYIPNYLDSLRDVSRILTLFYFTLADVSMMELFIDSMSEFPTPTFFIMV